MIHLSWFLCRLISQSGVLSSRHRVKGKPIERSGRKATGLRVLIPKTAELPSEKSDVIADLWHYSLIALPFSYNTCDEKDIDMKAQHTASRLVRKTVFSVCTSLLLGTALLPSTASAADGSVTFTGTIYESPCDFSDSSVTCYSGMNKQTMPLAHLQQAGQISSISSTISYKVTNASNMAIVTVSYLWWLICSDAEIGAKQMSRWCWKQLLSGRLCYPYRRPISFHPASSRTNSWLCWLSHQSSSAQIMWLKP